MGDGTGSSHRANVSDTTGLRRSTRETSSKKIIPSPSNTQKSDRFEKKTLPTPASRRKPERVEKKNMPSPLRRSGRTSRVSSSSPSNSKSSGSLSSNQKPKKEKSVKQLTFEAKEVNENGEDDLETSEVQIKRMDARMYRSFFKKPKGLVELKRIQPGCSGEETLQISVSRNSMLDEDLARTSVEHARGENLVPSKRKGNMVNIDSDVSATLVKDDNCSLILDPSRKTGNILGTDGSCSKRGRLDYNPTVDKSSNPSATEPRDGDDVDASLLQKNSPATLQTEVAKNICLICKSGGQLLFCDGKGCNGCYHLSCLEPPLQDAPPGIWHCQLCVRKKIEFGVYSVSEGIESVCDVKEVSCSNVDGSLTKKEFLVKYKGLAHVHNRWVPEDQLLLEAPSLLTKFNQKYQTLRLKPEWSLPHRLLQKRALTCGKQHDGHGNNHFDNVDCCYEWLVKWRDLGYEHATWELDNASFLCSPEGQQLIKGFEKRFERAKRVSSGSKLDKKSDQGSSINKLSQMPGEASSGFDSNNLNAVNKLREHWHKGQNAIVIDDQDRILTAVAFILSLHSDTYRPFLIISTAASLHSWEDEFYQLDPSIDVVVYNGNKEIRNGIRRLEFYDEEQSIIFEVLIVVPEIIIEDMDVLGGIEWEVIIVDECQSPKISSHFEQIKMLNTHLRILLFCGQLKDSVAENINFLALLDCQSDNEKDGLISNSNNSVVQLKERLSSHIAYRCKFDFFGFVEYWVPVQISQVQLEQYCATLLENASILRSSSKVDSIGSIRDVLISTRKCCSHPYVVDPCLRESLATKGLDFEIKASGKLQLLDLMLTELRKNDLRVLILFQTIGGSGRDLILIGNILEDLLRYRFGQDSYERVDKVLVNSKKQTAMREFNEKSNGRFVFLLETSACNPSIKLSSVDAIIIFDSDLNPMNDIRSIQRITLDSQFGLIKIFRLYSSFTVEEKALILSKQGKTLDNNLPNIIRSTSHMLLMWGASFLFDELRVFHDGETSESSLNSFFGQSLLKEAMHEFSCILSQKGEYTDTGNCSILLKVQRKWGTDRANISLFGERKLRLLDEELPHVFWTKLLEGKQYKWKFSRPSSQRSRKKVHQYDGSVDGPNLLSEGVTKKRRKLSNNIIDQPSSKSDGAKLSTEIRADRPQGDIESEKKNIQLGEQRSLYLLLKPEITKLCEVLHLPDNVKSMADNFLEYVMNNHHMVQINRESVSILQAFQISLCWTAASFLKHKLDHEVSLRLAKQYLNFDCKKEEADYIYFMLRCLKKIFSYRTGNYNDAGSPKVSESSNRAYSCTGGTREVELLRKDMLKSIKKIQKKCAKELKKLYLVQQEEKQRLIAAMEDEKVDVERKYKIELAVIRLSSPNVAQRTEKLKALSSEHDKRKVELKCQHETRLKNLEDTQSAQRLEFKERVAIWVEEVESWVENEINELLNIVASKELRTGVEFLQSCDGVQPNNDPKNHFAEGNDCCNVVITAGTGVPETNSPEVVLQNPLVRHIGANDLGIMISENRSVSRNKGHNVAENGAQIYVADDCNGANKSVTEKSPLSDERMADDALSVLEREFPSGMPGTDSITDCPENVTAMNLPLSSELISDGSAVNGSLDRELSRPCETACLSNGPDNITVVSSHLEHQTFDGASLSIPDGCIPVEVGETSNEGDTVSVLECQLPTESHEVVSLTDWLQDATPLDHPSSMDIISGGSSEPPVFDRVLSTMPCQAATSSNHQMSQETSVCGPVNVTEPLEQLHQSSSLETPHDQDAAGEIQNFSEAELVSNPVDVVLANQSNHVSQIVEPSVEVQQLPSAEFPSSTPDSANFPSATEVEYQPVNEVDLPGHQPVASMAPNQHVVQPELNSELGSRSHRVSMNPDSNSDLDSLTPGGIRAESSDPRNLSTPLGMNNHAMQTAPRSASRMPPHWCNDPFMNELERIRKVTDETKKNHEDMKLQLKSDFAKELEELRKKYDIKFQEIEVEFQQTKKTLDSRFYMVRANKILADAFKSKCLDLKASSPLGRLHDSSFAQQLVQLSRQQNATRTSTVAGPSSSRPPVTSVQSPAASASSQHTVPPPIQAGYNTPVAFSNASARVPPIKPTSSPSGNLRAGGEIRARATPPHLEPFRPSTSVPTPSLGMLPIGMSSQPEPSIVPAPSPTLPLPPRPASPTIHHSDPHMGRQPDSAGGLPSPNLPAMDLHANAISGMPANSSHQPTSPELVCLSDDD